MKTKSSTFTALASKALIILTAALFGFAGFYKCDAQSVVGKWKLMSIKGFMTIKADGKKQDISHPIQTQQIIEFKSDNTFISTMTVPKSNYSRAITGTYKFSGNQLEMNADMKNATAEQKKDIAALPKTATITAITANSMTWHYASDDATYKVDIDETLNKL